jgi:hypothetical protein
MKISITMLASALFGLAAAEDSPYNYFGAISARSASPIHFQTVSASGFSFWLGKDTASYCPLSPASACPPGTNTVFARDTSSQATTLGLAVNVPGGQQVYVAKNGALGYTQAHSGLIPKGAVTTGFTKTETESYGYLSWGEGFVACPTKGTRKEPQGPWKIYGQKKGAKVGSNCLGFQMLTSNVTEVGAWQYT